MTAQSFLKEYIEATPKIVGIPGVEMNSPMVAPNVKADVGLELEIEGQNLPTEGYFERFVPAEKSKAFWTVHEDGSLRNGGKEYVLSRPAFADEVDYLLKGLWELFKERGTRMQLTNRCSTHVHVNQSGRKVNEITAIIGLWTAFEEPLINWCGLERKTNHFCLSAKDTPGLIDTWDAYLRTGRGLNREMGDGFKYLSLNIKPLFNFGSLEFRTMRASESFEPILDWTMFIHGFCKYAAERYQNPMTIANDLSERGATGIFLDICNQAGVNPRFADEVLNHDDNRYFDDLVLTGFRRAQGIVMAHPWYDWLELCNQKFVPSPFGKKKAKSTNPFDDLAPEAPRRRFAPDVAAAFAGIQRRANAFLDEDQPQPAPPRTLPVYNVNPELPVEFTDGTPAVLMPGPNIGNDNIRQFASVVRKTSRDGLNLQDSYWYSLVTGWFEGTPGEAQIRNVGSLPYGERAY